MIYDVSWFDSIAVKHLNVKKYIVNSEQFKYI